MAELQESSLTPDMIHHQDVSRNRAAENDFAFFQDVITGCVILDSCPEFNGYNAKLCREHGHVVAPKTKIVYLPLIDKPPADAATMSAMVKAQQISEAAGQIYTILTLDQQLYRVALNVRWENKARFHNFYLRLGGMHLLMSYCGCIGTLMADTGIDCGDTYCCFRWCADSNVQVEIHRGVIIKTTHEEADTIIVQQVVEVNEKKVLLVAVDTDIFVLLLHFCYHGDISASTSVLMVSPIRGRSVIDINATIDQHRGIIPDLLATHRITGCDTAATYFGIGKTMALRVLRAG